MHRVTKYIQKNLEDFFILAILISVLLINFLVYSKVAFLDFYYLLIIMVGYYLGKRMAVLGAFLSILLVWVFVLADKKGYLTIGDLSELSLNLTIWGAFLILAGWLIGTLSEKLKQELGETRKLRNELEQEREALKESNAKLSQYSGQLKQMVAARTQELERSNRDLESFATVASHDLQEPLRKVIGFCDRARDLAGDTLDPRAHEYLVRAQKASGRMQDFIDDLLQFSRVHTKGKPFRSTDLNPVLQEVLNDLEDRIGQTGGRIEVGSLPTLEADPFQLRQLFQNLVINSLKFCEKGHSPVVQIRGVQLQNGSWTIMVADQGIGFDEKYADRVLKPFERLNPKGDYEGTGMGLAICRKIVSRHRGKIRIQSRVGKGTTVSVTLPEKQPASGILPAA